MIKLVINSDDLGLHPAVNRAVLELAKFGTLSSASVLANGRYLDNLSELSSLISLGGHLNILRGRPLSPAFEISSLLGSDGLFLGDYKKLYLRYLSGKLSLSEVKKEWRAQIIKLKNLGLTLSHLDSEKHTHAWPRLALIIRELADEFGIACVRRPLESPLPYSSGISGLLRTGLLRYWVSCAPEAYLGKCADRVWGIGHQGTLLQADLFRQYLNTLPENACVELVCHPGHRLPEDPELDPEFGSLRIWKTWASEFKLLMSDVWKTLVTEKTVRLVRYDHL